MSARRQLAGPARLATLGSGLAWSLVLRCVVALLVLVYGGSVVVGLALGDPADVVSADRVVGLSIRDREGGLVREPLGEQGDRGRWVGLEEVSPHLLHALVAAEDRRFYRHDGVDWASVLRASYQNATSGRIVSGASTITQQTVKLSTGGADERTVKRKTLEVMASVHFERHLGKDEILEAYVNWVPFGHLTRGVEKASWTYFDKPAAHLSLSESAALAALVRGPGALDPWRHPAALEKRRVWVLGRMLATGAIDEAEHRHAVETPPTFRRPAGVFRAPHLAEEVLARSSRDRFASGTVVTTIDPTLQARCEHLASSVVEDIRQMDVTNSAVVVIDNRSGEVLAWVGSAAYGDAEREGMNDGVTALRSPGSTLKPFVYAAAMERGYTPATLIADVETSFPTPEGPYRPRNYDGKWHGPVLLRHALGSSYNVPAVATTAHIGPGTVLDTLHDAGFDSLDEDASHYGAALSLGDGEVTLLELAAAYAALARGGTWRAPVLVGEIRDSRGETVPLAEPETRRAVPRDVAWLLTDILSDPAARAPAFGQARVFDLGYPVAVKTGTSHDYRDNWTVGYSSEVTVAVWVGNFDGKPMGNISGITGAGPLFRSVMIAAMAGRHPRDFPQPPDIESQRVCSLSGQLPGPGCVHTHEEFFLEGTAPSTPCGIHQVALVDRSTGLPAGPDTPAGDVRTVVLESYPPELLAWAEEAGRPLVPGALAASQTSTEATGPAILAPGEGAIFAIDPDVPRAHQKLEVALDVPAGATRAVLLVDGEPRGEADGPPWILDWVLEPGEHVLAARIGPDTSAPVSIWVE